jgi:glutathione S-transferase
MPTLYHLPLSPFCRKVRIVLKEKNVEFALETENVWERRPEFLALNPAGTVPVLVESDGRVIADSYAICEYVDEAYVGPSLLGRSVDERAETRRLVAWFDDKLNREVTVHLHGEKLMKRIARTGEPSSAALRAGRRNLRYHLEYIGWLCDRRTWLAGDDFSLADIAAGAHLSVLDYIGDVPWDEFEGAKLWYQRIKSRPSFRPLLADALPGMPPPRHYADLDF